ncbi:MAG: GNAT family N-acetyltransferase, partial [Clostridia bacterium]|nr:GNAT family N-acetyltransferase [Clostridia bacterium]
MTCSDETLTLRDGRCCTIRSVEPEDAAKMLQYMKIMLSETPFLLRTPEEFDYTPEEEARLLSGRKNDPRSLMLAAEMDGQIIASADVCSHGSKSRVQHRAELGISVRKDYWRQGIGSALMQRLIAFAVQCGYEQIELTVESKNHRALRLYMKYGFMVYGTRPHGMKYPDGSYDNDYLMIKIL